MPTTQSQFSRLPKKQLILITERLIDEDFPIGNPYESDFDTAYNILKDVSKYFSVEVVNEDVEFFGKFLEINGDLIAELFANNKEKIRNKELIEQLEIPIAKTYDLNYEVVGSCSYTDYLSEKFDCYDEDWVKDSAQQQNNDGSWSTWDGRERYPTEYENFQQNDYYFGDVFEVDEKRPKIESILDRLVVENTSEIVNSIDRETLLELRRIIDSKLRLL